jgi:hypothetical protein
MQISPTAEGFRTAFRRPSFTLAEITWRWVVGATATVLFFFGFFEYLNTLPVNNGELLFLKSRQPYLISQAIAHILRGSWNRAVLSLTLAALLLALLWMIAASLGRFATVRAILDHVHRQIAQKANAAGLDVGDTRGEDERAPSPLQALLRLNFLRVSLALATIVAFFGVSIVASFASSDAHPAPGLVFLIFLPLAALVGLAWFALNWLLSLSAVFAVRDRKDAVGAIAAAVGLCRDRTGAVFAVSTWTGLAHLVAFVAATTVVSVPLGLAGFLPWRLVVLGVLAVTLAFFAVADWVFTARLAGYVAILETPDAMLRPSTPTMPPLPPLPPVQNTIDKDELILSDLLNLVPETPQGTS